MREHDLIKREVERILTDVEQFTPVVRDHLHFKMAVAVSELVECAKRCESPIEQLLSVHLVRWVRTFNDKHYVVVGPDFEESGYFVDLQPQKEINVNGRRYRVDFLVDVVSLNDSPSVPSVVVECDGHDFHERTKEQARRDKRRDRDLQSAGYHVLRFTGSEIWRDPSSCAGEVARFVERLVQMAQDESLGR